MGEAIKQVIRLARQCRIMFGCAFNHLADFSFDQFARDNLVAGGLGVAITPQFQFVRFRGIPQSHLVSVKVSREMKTNFARSHAFQVLLKLVHPLFGAGIVVLSIFRFARLTGFPRNVFVVTAPLNRRMKRFENLPRLQFFTAQQFNPQKTGCVTSVVAGCWKFLL